MTGINDSTYRLKLDVTRAEAQGQVRVKMGDNARRIVFSLVSGAEPYVPGEGARAYLYARKPTVPETVVYNECSLSGSTATYEVTGGTTDAVGTLECELRIVDADSGKLLTSPRFRIVVDDVVYDDGAVEAAAETELGVLDDLVEDVEELIGDVDELTGEAEAWAAGTRDGVPVPPTDPAYHNNAKYYSSRSFMMAQAAENFAGQAQQAVPVVYGEPGTVVRVVYCTQEQYDGMASHDPNTDYRIYEE